MSAEGISFSLVGEKVIGGNLLALVSDQMLAREAELCSAGQTRASAPTRAPQTRASAPTRVVQAVGMMGLIREDMREAVASTDGDARRSIYRVKPTLANSLRLQNE